MEEVWKEIKGFKGYYQVSNLGRVRSLKFNKIKMLKNGLSGKGYVGVTLSIDAKIKKQYTHRLVAEAFVKKPKSHHDLIVDHINGITTDNRAENLQWLSYRNNFLKGKGVNDNKEVGVNPTMNGYFVSSINIKYNKIHLGCHKSDTKYLGKLYKKAHEMIHLYNGDNKEFRKLIKSSINKLNN